MKLNEIIKQHRIYWLQNNKLNYGTYSSDWSILIFYYLVISGAFDFMVKKAKIAHSWGLLLSFEDYKQGLNVLSYFLKENSLNTDDLDRLIENMLTPNTENVYFVHYGFVIDFDTQETERIVCNCNYCLTPIYEFNNNGESEKEIMAQLICVK